MNTRAEQHSIPSRQEETPLVSIVIPCRNEQGFIGKCLDSILSSDYPLDRLEILVVDGMSTDGTSRILSSYSERYSNIRVIENPKRITPAAFNRGIESARGELILIMSAHATYAPDAIRKLVRYSAEFGAENVGGIWKVLPRDNGYIGRGIAFALSHVFGIGGARYRLVDERSEPAWVDTAAYGCYRREVFEKIGLYNEDLVHSQDIELNLRLKSAGGRTLLAPDVVIHYYARTKLSAFAKHNFRNGQWVILPFAYSEVMPVAWRHLVPLAFAGSLLVSGIGALFSPISMLLFAGILFTYLLANFAASALIARREHDVRYLFVMPIVFGILHLCYGFGSVWGLYRLAWNSSFWRRVFCLKAAKSSAVLGPGVE